MAKLDSNFRMDNSSKLLYSGMSKQQRKLWKKLILESNLVENTTERFMMLYDVSPSGKIPKKVKVSADVEQV